MMQLIRQRIIRSASALSATLVRPMSTQNVLEIKKSQIKPKPKHPNYAPQAALPLRLQALNFTHDPAKVEYKQALAAFAARIGAQFSDAGLLRQALTFPDFANGVQGSTNEQLIPLGQELVDAAIGKHAKARFPNFTDDLTASFKELHLSPESLADLAMNLGVQYVVLCKETELQQGVEGEIPNEKTAGIPATTLQQSVFAIIGAFHQAQGEAASQQWISRYILSRELDLLPLISVPHPKNLLTSLMKAQKRPLPTSRILSETGRASHASMYVVGVFSGNQLLGQGHARAIKLASNLAARNALLAHYLKENPGRTASSN